MRRPRLQRRGGDCQLLGAVSERDTGMDGPSILTSFPPRGPKRERDARAAAAAAKTSASVCRYTKQVARNPREPPRCSADIKFASNENLVREISSQSVFPMPRHGERFSPTADV